MSIGMPDNDKMRKDTNNITTQQSTTMTPLGHSKMGFLGKNKKKNEYSPK